jgi:hypothetical protein
MAKKLKPVHPGEVLFQRFVEERSAGTRRIPLEEIELKIELARGLT